MQFVTDVVKWLDASSFTYFIAESSWVFQAALMLHLAATVVVFGMIAVVDLRLMGLASMGAPVTDILRQALPWTWWSFAISVVTGGVLYMAQPEKYFFNPAFQMKFLLMIVAGINMLIFHFMTYRGVASWDNGAPVPLTAKFAGTISLVSWIAVVAYARWTAYSMF